MRAHHIGMKNLTTWKQRSDETSRGELGPQRTLLPATPKSRLGEFLFQGGNSTFFGEWQEHGPEALPGIGVRKLRLVFGPPQSVVIASAAG